MDWREHLRSLRKKWIQRYLDETQGAWKQVLDTWVTKGHALGRGVLLGTGETNEAPNAFWDAAIEEFKTLTIKHTKLGITDPWEALEEPVWEGHRVDPPEVENQDLWEGELGLRQIKDMIDRGDNQKWTGNQWYRWIQNGPQGVQAFGGKDKANSEHGSIKHATTMLVNLALRANQPGNFEVNETVAYFNSEGEIHFGRVISPNVLAVLKKVELTPSGEPITIPNIITIPSQAYNHCGEKVNGPPVWKIRMRQISPPLERGRKIKGASARRNTANPEGIELVDVYDGVLGTTYPTIENIQIQYPNTAIPFTDMTVKELTMREVERTGERPTCERTTRWPIELGLDPNETINFPEVWNTFKIGIATPVDFGTRFRMICGDLGTRSKLGLPGGCRLGCGAVREKHVHLVDCPILQPLWVKLRNILEGLRGKPFKKWKQAVVLGWSTREGAIEKGSTALISMLLKIIHIEWYLVVKHNKPFDHTKVWKIFWARAQRQWKETAKDKEYELRNIQQRGSNTKSTWIGISRQLKPIGTIDRETCQVKCNLQWGRHEQFP